MWNQLANLLKEHDITLTDASAILDMRPTHLADALYNPETHRILTFETAQLLTAHLKLAGGPLTLVPPPESDRSDDHTR
jgi:hypothetical protein